VDENRVDTADLRDGTEGAAPAPGGSDVLLALEGSGLVVTLNRPAALNALTDAMRAQLLAGFPRWSRDPNVYAVLITSSSERAFCAGGDVRELTDWGRRNLAAARRSLADEYKLNWQVDCFTKPTVSLMDGPVIGGGVGLTLYGTHRVAGERYRFSMPETGIGLFPDDGVSSKLVRMPDEIGMYLALTGRSLGPADAHRLGLLTHCIPAARFGEVRAAICDADPVDPVLDGRHEDPGAGEIEPLQPVIARCFSAESVEAILARLRLETGNTAGWAEQVLAELARRSPLSLKVTYRQMREARGGDLATALARDYRLACRFLEGADLYEGVRAMFIDRGSPPRWQPGRLEDVSDAMVDAYFTPIGPDELDLPARPPMLGFNR
jgi:enoyl-CoA hydratase/carnithine racemase